MSVFLIAAFDMHFKMSDFEKKKFLGGFGSRV